MAGYHCLMPNGIFPANPSPMSNGILSLLTAPCILPNVILFAGCHCPMSIGILSLLTVPCILPNGIFFAIVHPQYYSFFYILLLMCMIYHWCPLKMPKA